MTPRPSSLVTSLLPFAVVVAFVLVAWLSSSYIPSSSWSPKLVTGSSVSIKSSGNGDSSNTERKRKKEKLEQHVEQSIQIAACARIKNEGTYIQEWLEFHQMVGIDHFYIWDDSSTDNTRAVLAPYVRSGVVTLHTSVDHSHDAEHGQYGHRDMCLTSRYNVANATWVAMIDADEFLFPSTSWSLREHLASCPSSVAYLMVRWHMFGSNGLHRRPQGLVTEHYRMHNGAPRKEVCPPKIMGCFDQSPPLSTKLLVQPRCVKKMGTHYVTELRNNNAGDCLDIYTPLGSKRTRIVGWEGHKATPKEATSTEAESLANLFGSEKRHDSSSTAAGLASHLGVSGNVGVSHAAARAVHRSCAAPLHLNHYAVKSREDYLAKFQRGRISRGEKDLKAGLAIRNESNGQVVLKPLPASAVAIFLGEKGAGEEKHKEMAKTEKLGDIEQTLLDIALNEFELRDYSEVRDESILRYIPELRKRMVKAPQADKSSSSSMVFDDQYSPIEPLSSLDPTVLKAPAVIAPACSSVPAPVSLSLRALESPQNHADYTSLSRSLRFPAPSPEFPLVYLHIPKTGGTNFNLQLAAIGRRLKHGGFCEVRTSDAHKALPPSLIADMSGGYIGGGIMSSMWRGVSSLFFGGRGGADLRDCSIVSGEFDASILVQLRSIAQKRGSDAGSGSVDKARYLATIDNATSSSNSVKQPRQFQAMTMLRDPIARTISQFEHHISRDRYFAASSASVTSTPDEPANATAKKRHAGNHGVSSRKQKQAVAQNSRDTKPLTIEQQQQQRRSRALMHLVSPMLCPQTERRGSERCSDLSNPLKCRGNGWCGIFQNHQTESLAGAMSLSPAQAQRLRRSGDQLLCTAKATLLADASDGAGVSFVGLMEHYHASVCLLLHTYKVGGSYFGNCCEADDGPDKGANCELLKLKTEMNSANERSASGSNKARRLDTPPHRRGLKTSAKKVVSESQSHMGKISSKTNKEKQKGGKLHNYGETEQVTTTTAEVTTVGTSSGTLRDRSSGGGGGGTSKNSTFNGYIERYLEDETLLAALYDGNRLDCELYRTAAILLEQRLRSMEMERGIRVGRFSSSVAEVKYTANCRRAASAYATKHHRR